MRAALNDDRRMARQKQQTVVGSSDRVQKEVVNWRYAAAAAVSPRNNNSIVRRIPFYEDVA